MNSNIEIISENIDTETNNKNHLKKNLKYIFIQMRRRPKI